MTGEPRQIVVSGGGTGIGRATANAFAAAGERVLILGRRESVLADAARELPGTVDWRALDVADTAAAASLAEELRAVDVLVHCAGGIDRRDGDSLKDVAEGWLADFRSSVLTAVVLTHALLERMRRPGGRIVLVSSIAALRGGGGSYSAAKSALHGFAYDLAARLGPDGITANVVAPGYVAGTEFFGGPVSAERERRYVDETRTKRVGQPEDVAAAIRFLASAEAKHITGELLQVNGGALFGR